MCILYYILAVLNSNYTLTHYSLLYVGNFKCVSLLLIVMIDIFSTAGEVALRWVPHDVTENMSPLVPTGNKPLPEPILAKICIVMWHH